MNIQIRKAVSGDYDAVEKIMKQVQQLHIDLRPDIFCPVDTVLSRDEYEEEVQRECCFVAEIDGLVIGLASILYRHVNVPHMVKRDVLFIETLAVDSSYRRLGVGKALLNYLIELKKEKNMDGLELQVNARNMNALKMYEACGFTMKSINMEITE